MVERDVGVGGVEELIYFEISIVSAILEAETQNSVPFRYRLSHFKSNSSRIVDYDRQ